MFHHFLIRLPLVYFAGIHHAIYFQCKSVLVIYSYQCPYFLFVSNLCHKELNRVKVVSEAHRAFGTYGLLVTCITLGTIGSFSFSPLDTVLLFLACRDVWVEGSAIRAGSHRQSYCLLFETIQTYLSVTTKVCFLL